MSYSTYNTGESSGGFAATLIFVILGLIIVAGLFYGLFFGLPNYKRGQVLLEENNKIQVNEIRIKQTEQLVQVEKQKAEIKVAEANGIAEAQKIINLTLTDRYLQHEAIQAQESMASSPNHTTIYIPSGQNGIPLVKTLE